MGSLYFWMFVVGGVSLIALVWLGAADDGHGDAVDSPQAIGALALLSVRSVLAAMTLAGAVGVAMTAWLRVPPPVAGLAAACGAVAGAWTWRRVMRSLRAFDRNHAVSRDVMLGREGRLTVGIGGREAPGVVQLTLGGVSQEYTAFPADGDALAEGTIVTVVRLLSDSAVAVAASRPSVLPPRP